jgi:hypothetical protein
MPWPNAPSARPDSETNHFLLGAGRFYFPLPLTLTLLLPLTLPLTENAGPSPAFIYERARLRALSSKKEFDFKDFKDFDFFIYIKIISRKSKVKGSVKKNI